MTGSAAIAVAAAAAATALLGAAPVAGLRSGQDRRWTHAVAPRTWLLLAAGGLVCLVAGGRLTVAVWFALAAGVAVGANLLWRRRSARLRADTRRAYVLAACDLLAAELRAGRPPSLALRAAARDWPELDEVVRAEAFGADVPRAWRRLADRGGGGDLRLVAAAWRVTERTGSGMAEALSRVAALTRAGEATRRTVASELASARATARLMAALPVAALAIGGTTGGDPIAFLLSTTLGLACLAGGLAVGWIGLAWIERIADDVTRDR